MNWLFPYRTHLENELKQQRADFETRLAEKNLQIRVLRSELAAAKAVQVEPPPDSLAAAVRTFQDKMSETTQGPQDWQGELNKLLKEEEDGIRNRGRIQEHEQSTDDGS